MVTKTISLELDAYERLRAAKRDDSESFSMVIRRATWSGLPKSGAEILAQLRNRREFLGEDALDEIEMADRTDSPPSNPWEENP